MKVQMCKFMIETVGWKLALCVISALILVCCVSCGLLYRPLTMPDFDPKMVEDMKRQALLAALSRAEGTEDGTHQDEDGASVVEGAADGDGDDGREYVEDMSGGTSPFTNKRSTLRSTSECTDHSQSAIATSGREDAQPLLTSDGIRTSVDGGAIAGSQAESSTPGRTKLSPIHEGKPLNSLNRSGSQQHHQPSTATAGIRETTRTRKATLTSINSEFASSIGELAGQGFHCQLSRTNLASNHNLARVSARSYAHSLSRIGQPQSIRAGESVLSIAMSVSENLGGIKHLREFYHFRE